MYFKTNLFYEPFGVCIILRNCKQSNYLRAILLTPAADFKVHMLWM